MPRKKVHADRNARMRALRERRSAICKAVTLYLAPATHAALKELSERWDLPMASVIARLCEDEMRYQAHKDEASDETV
jgi:RNase P subunit RPR2